MFQHDGKNARTNNPAKVFGGQTTAARVTVEPLRHVKDAVGDLSLGVALTRSDVARRASRGCAARPCWSRTSSPGTTTSSTVRAGASGIEMQFRPGPASIKSEWMRVETDRRGESVEDTDLSPIVGEGWYVSGTYAITGEKKSNVDRPKKPLFQGGFGAIEVGARVESLKFKSGTAGEPGSTQPARRHHPRQRRPGHHVRRELVHQPLLQDPGELHPGEAGRSVAGAAAVEGEFHDQGDPLPVFAVRTSMRIASRRHRGGRDRDHVRVRRFRPRADRRRALRPERRSRKSGCR